jgi:hypothetical protein
MITGAVQEVVPLVSSEQAKLTVVSELFHPAAFGAGVTFAMMVGGVLSNFTRTDTVAVFPAVSTAVPTTDWPAVSVVIVTGGVQEAIPLVVLEQVKVTVGLDLFHPAAFGAGLTVAVIVGGTLFAPPKVAANLEERLPASKYNRSPTALLWPPQLAPAALVPIRVSILSDSTSVVPLNKADENVVNEATTSFALSGFLVTPTTHKVTPDVSSAPFLYASTRRSKFVP